MRRQPESRFVLVRANAALKVGYQTFDQQIDDQLDVMLRAYKEGAHVRTPLNVTPIGKQIVRLVDALPDNINDFISLPPITAKATASPGRVARFSKSRYGCPRMEQGSVHQACWQIHGVPGGHRYTCLLCQRGRSCGIWVCRKLEAPCADWSGVPGIVAAAGERQPVRCQQFRVIIYFYLGILRGNEH